MVDDGSYSANYLLAAKGQVQLFLAEFEGRIVGAQ